MAETSTCVLLLILIIQVSSSRISKRETTPVQLESNNAVKVFHLNQWGYICANKWNSNDAKVICRMMGYWLGSGTASIITVPNNVYLLDNVVCGGNEKDISQCQHAGWNPASCPLQAVAGVDCTSTAKANIRLVDGFVPWEGRAEIYSGGMWHPICGHQWDNQDARVICRALGLSQSGGTAHVDGKYGKTGVDPFITDVVCLGHESDLGLCKASTDISDTSCPQAGVECYNCGGEFHSESGQISSANFPGSYPGYQHCLYVIRPSDNKQLYKLEFPDFKTEACCDKLQVTLLTGSLNFPEGGKVYSGDDGPPMLLGKAFAIMFNTDGSNNFMGFQAKWSPARVEDLVDISCDSGTFKITIDLLTLKRLYPQSSEKSIALANPNCTGSMTADDKLVITSATNDCGTRVSITGTSQIYTNFLVDRVFSTNPMIVRQERWRIPITCEVQRDKSFLLHYNPFASGKRDTLLRSRRELKGMIHQSNPFPVQFEVFSDNAMTLREYGVPKRHLGDDLYLRLDLTSGDSDLNLVVDNCYARPSYSSTAQKYYLIQNGCAVDSQTTIIRRESHFTDIHVVVFEFAGDYPDVYITCEARVCPDTDHAPSCVQACSTHPGRSLEVRAAKDFVRVTFGPISIEK